MLALKGMKRKVVNICVGPPADREDDRSYFETFFQKEGMRVVCGGTTAKLVADYMGKKIISLPESGTEEVPAMSAIQGIDLVTEGLLTLQKLTEYYGIDQKEMRKPAVCQEPGDADSDGGVRLYGRHRENLAGLHDGLRRGDRILLRHPEPEGAGRG